jgi:hypothetical protein
MGEVKLTESENSPALQDELPWTALPSGVSSTLRKALPSLVEEIIDRIPREVPEYARPLEGAFGLAVRQGVEIALSRLLMDLPGSTEPALTSDASELYFQLGMGEARTGRSLEALLSAYRLGARVTFRAVSAVAQEAGLDSAVLLPLGESIFVYIDEISAASIAGFAQEQSRQLGERDRRRDALLDRLLNPVVDEEAARAHATRAEWVVPSHVVALVVPLASAEELRLSLDDRALLGRRGDFVVAVLPAPAGRPGQRKLVSSLDGRHAWIGPQRRWEQAGESFRAARLAATLPTLSSPDPRARWVSDHLAAMVLGSEDYFVTELAAQCFAPLTQLRPGQRERLAETLFAWLRHRGERGPIAQELHIHPQTVGYRLGQLREVFGEMLDDPDRRFELELVLRAGKRP